MVTFFLFMYSSSTYWRSCWGRKFSSGRRRRRKEGRKVKGTKHCSGLLRGGGGGGHQGFCCEKPKDGTLISRTVVACLPPPPKPLLKASDSIRVVQSSSSLCLSQHTYIKDRFLFLSWLGWPRERFKRRKPSPSSPPAYL